MKKAPTYFQSFIYFLFELSSFADKCTARWLLMIHFQILQYFLVQTQKENCSLFMHFWSHVKLSQISGRPTIFGIHNVGRGTCVIDWKKVVLSFWPAELTCHAVTILFIFEAVPPKATRPVIKLLLPSPPEATRPVIKLLIPSCTFCTLHSVFAQNKLGLACATSLALSTHPWNVKHNLNWFICARFFGF